MLVIMNFVKYFIISCDCDENVQIQCCLWSGLLKKLHCYNDNICDS